MILRAAIIFLSVTALAYVAMATAFWILCKTTGHFSLEAVAGFTTSVILAIALGVEASLWLKDRSLRIDRRPIWLYGGKFRPKIAVAK